MTSYRNYQTATRVGQDIKPRDRHQNNKHLCIDSLTVIIQFQLKEIISDGGNLWRFLTVLKNV